MKRNLALLLLFIVVGSVNAQQWIATGTKNWSDPTAWDNGQVPGPSDYVYFTGTGTCNLDMDITVAHFEFAQGFAGVFNQNSYSITILTHTNFWDYGMLLRTGTFNGGNKKILIKPSSLTGQYPYASFQLGDLSGGPGATFTSTSDSLIIYGGFTNRGTFNHNNGTVVLAAEGTAGLSLSDGDFTFYNLEFRAVGNPMLVTMPLFHIDTLTVLNDFSKTGKRVWIASGNVNLHGDLLINDEGTLPANIPTTTKAFIRFVGTGDQHIVGKAATYTENGLESITINKPSGTLFLHNYITLQWDWILIAGNIDPGTSTVFFYGGNGVTEGDQSFYNVRVANLNEHAFREIGEMGSSDTTRLTILNDLFIDGNNFAALAGGYIHVKGDIIVTNVPGGVSWCRGYTNIVIDGTGDQTLEGQTTKKRGYLPTIIIDKPSGTLFVKDTVCTSRNWIYKRGNVDLFTYNAYIVLGSNWDYNDEPARIDGQGISQTMVFNNIEIYNENTADYMERQLYGDLRIKGKIYLNNAKLQPYAYDIYFESNLKEPFERTTGSFKYPTAVYGVPEVQYMRWFIDEHPAGTDTFQLPFEKTGAPPTSR